MQGLNLKTELKGKDNFSLVRTAWRYGIFDYKKTNKFSIVSIDNWALYQEVESSDDNSLTIKRPSNDHQMTTNKNVKKGKNEKNIKPSRLKYEICDMENAEYLLKKSKTITRMLKSRILKNGKI